MANQEYKKELAESVAAFTQKVSNDDIYRLLTKHLKPDRRLPSGEFSLDPSPGKRARTWVFFDKDEAKFFQDGSYGFALKYLMLPKYPLWLALTSFSFKRALFLR